MQRNNIFKCMLLISLIASMSTLAAMTAAGQTKRKTPKCTVPTDTIIRLRMNDRLSSKKAQVGSSFNTTVVTPVYVKGVQCIPAGAVVQGHVTHVERASRKSEAGSLSVTFTSIKTPNGVSYSISGSLAASDNSNNESEIKGKSSKKRNARFIGRGMVVGGLISGGSGVVSGGLIGAARGFIKKGQEAEVEPGTEFDMILNRSVSMSAFR